MPLTEKHWTLIITAIGVLGCLLIYGLTMFFLDRREQRFDRDRRTWLKELLKEEFPETPFDPKGKPS